MTAQIMALPTPKAICEQSLVEMLEDLLVMAKRGEIIAAAAGVVYADRHTGSFASQNECASSQIGAVSVLLHELNSNAAANGKLVIGRPPQEPA